MNLDKLGERLRHIRRIKKFRLSDVARLVPCSESMLSKIETGRIIPSLHLLQRITMVLDITTAELVDNSNESAVLIYKKGTRTNIQLGDSGNHGLILQRLIPFSRGRILNANIHIISPGSGNGGELKHVGEEIGFVLEGQIELTVGNEVYVLNAEDSFFFESHIPHRYRNTGKTVARVLWVNSPIV